MYIPPFSDIVRCFKKSSRRPLTLVETVVILSLFGITSILIGRYYIFSPLTYLPGSPRQNPREDVNAVSQRVAQVSEGVAKMSDRLGKIELQVERIDRSLKGGAFRDVDDVIDQVTSEMVQEHLFKKYISRGATGVTVAPFEDGSTVESFLIPTTVWDAYSIRRFEWSEPGWNLFLRNPESSSTNDPRFSKRPEIQIFISQPDFYNQMVTEVPPPPVCDEKKYNERMRQIVGYFQRLYPNDDWNDPCSKIGISDPLNYPTSNSSSVRVYIYRRPPPPFQTDIETTFDIVPPRIPVAAGLIARDEGDDLVDWFLKTHVEWSLLPRETYDGRYFLNKDQTVLSDIGKMIDNFPKSVKLYTGFCGYECGY